MEHYDKDHIPPSIMAALRNERFLENEHFIPDVVKKSSKACDGLCRWVRAMDVYDVVADEPIDVLVDEVLGE